MPFDMVLFETTKDWGMVPLIVVLSLVTIGRMRCNDLFIFPFFIILFELIQFVTMENSANVQHEAIPTPTLF
jgi:hypothetical protein